MIRVNLLAPELRPAPRPWLPPEQHAAAIGLVILLATACGLGAWWWELGREVSGVDRQVATAQADLTRLHAVAERVDRATARRAELLERANLIDRLHRGAREPVELLQVVSESLPDGLWLLELKQLPDDSIQIEGRAKTLTAVTDLVERLQTSGRFQRPIDIVATSMEMVQDVSVVRFAIKGTALRAVRPASVPGSAGQ